MPYRLRVARAMMPIVIFKSGWPLRRCASQPPAYADGAAPGEWEAQPLRPTLADAGPDAALRDHRFRWGRSGHGSHVRFPFVLRRRLRLGRCAECLLRQAKLGLAAHTTLIAPLSPRTSSFAPLRWPASPGASLGGSAQGTKFPESGQEVNRTTAILARLRPYEQSPIQD